MFSRNPRGKFWLLIGLLTGFPALHPFLIPLVGVPSHLLWWVHVLPVAILTYRYGRRGGLLCSRSSFPSRESFC